jgi:hypothetical protein
MAYKGTQLLKILGTLAAFALFAIGSILVSVWLATPRQPKAPAAEGLPVPPPPPLEQQEALVVPTEA